MRHPDVTITKAKPLLDACMAIWDHVGAFDEVSGPLADMCGTLRAFILETPAATADDLRVKLEVFKYFIEDPPPSWRGSRRRLK